MSSGYQQGVSSGTERRFPAWLPGRVRLYMRHTSEGCSLRALARDTGLNASTVMRQVRQFENRRDDPLMDAALDALSRQSHGAEALIVAPEAMAVPQRPGALPDERLLHSEGRRVLRRLVEPGAVLAFATDMEKAVVLRSFPDGRSTRVAVLDRGLAQAFSLNDWVYCRKAGRISTYAITPAGRNALKSMLTGSLPQGIATTQAPPPAEHRGLDAEAAESAPMARLHFHESPIQTLARRRDKNGMPFLSTDLVASAERLREDYELALLETGGAEDWRDLLPQGRALAGLVPEPLALAGADGRLRAALAALGPELGEVALRICCKLEGVERLEQRQNWAARSGKIVLRLALLMLKRHYDATYGRSGPLIG